MNRCQKNILTKNVTGLILASLFILLQSTYSFAEVIAVLHTNDLHSYFEGIEYPEKLGSYARIKTLMDWEETKFLGRDIPSLRLDAGDFSEGNIFYTANQGQNSFKIMDLMGYDAVVLGNHDYLMGTGKLNEILEQVSPEVPILAANLKMKVALPGIQKHIQPYKIIKIGNVRVGIIGVTTNELFYRWRVTSGAIKNPIRWANLYAEHLKKNKFVDAVIAVTHIGVEEDIKLAEKSSFIDLIIGGHSHTKLSKAKWVLNQNKKFVPIVQTGEHGQFLGRLVIDVNRLTNQARLLSYDLLPVERSIQEEENIKNFVAETREAFEDQFGKEKLHDVIAYSEVPLISKPGEKRIFSQILVESIKESVNADVALCVHEFYGNPVPAGAITKEKIINLFPRIFDFEDADGWHIYYAKMDGNWLSALIQLALKKGYPLQMAGVEYHESFSADGKLKLDNLKINGNSIKMGRTYKVAVPEGIIWGAYGITDLARAILRKGTKSPVTIWEAVEKKLRKVRVIRDNMGHDPDFLDLPRHDLI